MSVPALKMSLQFADATHRGLLPRHKVARWIRAALEAPAEITVRVVGEDEGRALNRRYRGKDAPTNVLAFVYDDVSVGDIVLCAPLLRREAHEQKKALEVHCAHLVVHGMLHLQGYDHKRGSEAARMEAREVAILAALGLANPYLQDARR